MNDEFNNAKDDKAILEKLRHLFVPDSSGLKASGQDICDICGGLAKADPHKPKLVIVQDHDGYFETLVRKMIDNPTHPWKHHRILVESRPFHPEGCSYKSKNGILELIFYSALRHGFGQLTKEDLLGIEAIL